MAQLLTVAREQNMAEFPTGGSTRKLRALEKCALNPEPAANRTCVSEVPRGRLAKLRALCCAGPVEAREAAPNLVEASTDVSRYP